MKKTLLATGLLTAVLASSVVLADDVTQTTDTNTITTAQAQSGSTAVPAANNNDTTQAQK